MVAKEMAEEHALSHWNRVGWGSATLLRHSTQIRLIKFLLLRDLQENKVSGKGRRAVPAAPLLRYVY